MKQALVFLAEGFEEIEAITTIDLLRRGGVEVKTISVGASQTVTGAHGIPVQADELLTTLASTGADAYILPGGLPGVTNLAAEGDLKTLLLKAYEQGKLLAAICAAPSIFGELGLLEGKQATCYPSFEPTLVGYIPTAEPVVTAGQIITGRSAGVTIDFALAILAQLEGQNVADDVARAIIVK